MGRSEEKQQAGGQATALFRDDRGYRACKRDHLWEQKCNFKSNHLFQNLAQLTIRCNTLLFSNLCAKKNVAVSRHRSSRVILLLTNLPYNLSGFLDKKFLNRRIVFGNPSMLDSNRLLSSIHPTEEVYAIYKSSWRQHQLPSSRRYRAMHVNDTFGQANATAIAALIPKLNLPFQVVETISYDPAAKDLTVEVSKAKNTKADFLLLVCRLNDAIMLRREIIKQRWNTMGIVSPGSPGMYESQFFKALGKLSNGCISNVPWFDPKSSLTQAVEAAFTKQYPNDQLRYHALNVGYTFEAILIAADAFKRAKTTSPQPLTAAIRQTEIKDRMMIEIGRAHV